MSKTAEYIHELKMEIHALQAENERYHAELEHIRAWCTQDQDMLSSRMVADAVIRMIDDAMKGGDE